MTPIIQCENITHYYGKKLIYENLNFEVTPGKILGLLGKNGTGKTTIINILTGYLQPRSGICRLFVEYLREYITAEDKTVFLTSHIIQDMELLIDDCIILDYGRILLHEPTSYILDNFKQFRFSSNKEPASDALLWHTEQIGKHWITGSFASEEEVRAALSKEGATISGLTEERVSLEDAFIGLTGKY